MTIEDSPPLNEALKRRVKYHVANWRQVARYNEL